MKKIKIKFLTIFLLGIFSSTQLLYGQSTDKILDKKNISKDKKVVKQPLNPIKSKNENPNKLSISELKNKKINEKACKKNMPNSCYIVGFLERKAGKTEAAKENFKKACDKGHHVSCNFLNIMAREKVKKK